MRELNYDLREHILVFKIKETKTAAAEANPSRQTSKHFLNSSFVESLSWTVWESAA